MYNGTSYSLSGPADAPVLALIHGLGLSRAVFDGLLPALTGYRVLSYDLYGHGHSTAYPGTTSLTVYARQLADLMDHLGMARAHILGFSIGGMINRRFALDHPEKTASLAILNAPHDRGTDAQLAVEDRAKAARNQGAFATFDAAITRWFTPHYRATGDGPALVRAWREQVDDESYAQAAWVLAQGVRELIGRGADITAPSLVITCENDSGSTPAMSHDIAADLPNARIKIIPKLQHLGLIEDPEAFTNPLLDFLNEQA